MKLIILILSIVLLFSCKDGATEPTPVIQSPVAMVTEQPELIHNVYFWAKEGTSPERLKDIEKGLEALGKCPSIQNYYWGPSASTEDREVVDHSYDYSVSVHFANMEDQNQYQTDPIHLKFIEDCQDIWGKVVVYDNVVN